jgi:hypothetical protein
MGYIIWRSANNQEGADNRALTYTQKCAEIFCLYVLRSLTFSLSDENELGRLKLASHINSVCGTNLLSSEKIRADRSDYV